MAPFDWQTFLDRHGVSYRTQKKDLYIHCPFCGPADSGQHMGISVVGKGWGCWRQQLHRGKAPDRLIQALLGCSWVEAQRISGRGAAAHLTGLGGFMAAVEGALGASPPVATAGPLVKPPHFRRLEFPRPGAGRMFVEYLGDRGFTAEDIERLCLIYDLHYAVSGDWSYRLIIPVPDRNGKWYTWTGRAITDMAKLRYKTLTADPDKAGAGPVSRGPITDCLLGLPDLFKGGRTLVLAEGPFDAMRLSLFTGQYDMRATCLFGKAVTPAQLDLLARLRPLYTNLVLLLDPDASLDSMGLQTKLAPLGATYHLLQGDDDPGEMKGSAIRALLRQLPNRVQPVYRADGL